MRRPARYIGGFGAALVLAFTGLVAGCGGGQRVNVAGVERIVTSELSRTYAPAQVTATACPGSPPLKADTTFRCKADVAGQAVEVKVTLLDSKGAISFATTRAVIVTSQVEADLGKRLHEAYDEPGDIMKISVRCPGSEVRVLDVGDTFRCTAVAGDTTMIDEVTVADVNGAVSFRTVN